MEVLNAADQALFNGVDDATAALIFQSYLDDSKQLFEESQARSKNKEGVLSDYQLALKLNEEEMKRGSSTLSDRQMSKSMTRAVLNDAQMLAAAQEQDNIAAEDRRMAFELGGIPPNPVAVQVHPVAPEQVNDRDLEVLKARYVQIPELTTEPDVNITGHGLIERERDPLVECVVCQEKFRAYEATPLECDHNYCRDCVQDLFNKSFTDESLFPPKCCGKVMEPASIRLFLTANIMAKYERRKIELTDPHRTYCSVKTCSSYIPQTNIRSECAACPECSVQTCTLCQTVWHFGACPKDSELQNILTDANREGWQRCSACRTMVDLVMGCNHITCRCGHEFCYECGVKWKTCVCAQWNEARLMEERLRGQEQEQVPGAAARVACDHPRFVRRPGRHVCDTCGDGHARFGFKCTACNTSRCATCRFNR